MGEIKKTAGKHVLNKIQIEERPDIAGDPLWSHLGLYDLRDKVYQEFVYELHVHNLREALDTFVLLRPMKNQEKLE